LTPTPRAESALLHARVLELEREQRVQFGRIAQIQRQLDDIKKLLEKMSDR
jgi:hypothetical protein